MGDTANVVEEIEKVSEIKPNVLDAKGVVIATFSSVVEPKELTDWFKLNKRSFLVFDLSPDSSGVHITKPAIHDGLFGFLKNMNLTDLDDKFLKAIQMTSDTKTNHVPEVDLKMKSINVKSQIKYRYSEAEIKKMTKNEKDELWNKIMDKGVEKLTDDDKKLLQFLSK